MSYNGLDFRGSAAFVTDPSDYTYVLAGDSYGTSGVTRGGLTFGHTGSAPYQQNLSASFDPRLAGYLTLNTYNLTFRIDLPNGLYTFQLGVGHHSISLNNAIYVWDGAFRDYTNNVGLGSGNVIDYPASGTSVAAGKYVLRAGNLYRASQGGVTAGNPPAGTGDTTDGSVVWAYIRSALIAVSAAPPATARILDASGNVLSEAAWPAGQAPSGAVAVTRGFVTATRGDAFAFLRSIAWQDAAPANTAAPDISSATIGTAMGGSDGSWSNADGATFTAEYWVDGVSAGATYVPTEADRTKSVVRRVTATLPNGASSYADSAAVVVRRTEPEVAYNFGKLTPRQTGTQYWGKVRIRNLLAAPGRPCLGSGVAEPMTWSLDSGAADGGVISGNPANWAWTLVGDGYTPCIASGQSISGTYVFRTKADWSDGVSETQNLVISAKDNVATIGDYDAGHYDFLFKTTLKNAVTAGDTIADNAVELAVGFARGTSIRFQLCRATKRIIIRNADLDRPAVLSLFQILGSNNLKAVGIRTDNIGTPPNRFNISTSGTDSLPSSAIEISDYQHLGSTPNPASVNTGLMLFSVDGLVADGIYLKNVRNGLASSRAVNCVVSNLVVDGFSDNGFNLGGDSAGAGSVINGLTITDFLIMRPSREDGTHIDGIQIADRANGGYIRFVRGIIEMAGGNAAMQGLFGGTATATAPQRVPLDVSVSGLLCSNRGYHGLTNSRGSDSTWRYFGLIRHNGTNLPEEEFGATDTPLPEGPWIKVGAADANLTAGTNLIEKGYASDTISQLGGWTLGSALTQWDRDNGESGTAMAAQFANGDPEAFLDAIADTAWLAKSASEVIAAVKEAHRPATGAAIIAGAPIDPLSGDWRSEVLAA